MLYGDCRKPLTFTLPFVMLCESRGWTTRHLLPSKFYPLSNPHLFYCTFRPIQSESPTVMLIFRARYPSLLDDLDGSAKEACRFECVVSPPFGLQTAILYGIENGLYMDSSWRNKSAFRCPLTLICTMNEYHRMIPGENTTI